MTFLGRRVIPTILDPLPRGMRAAPGVIAMNTRELKALEQNDGGVFKDLAEICYAEDATDARFITAWKRRKHRARVSPSTRLSMLNAIYRKV